MTRKRTKLRLLKNPKSKGGEDMNLRVKKKLRKVGGGAAIPIPMDFLNDLKWEPGKTEVYVTLNQDGTVEITANKPGPLQPIVVKAS